MEKKPRVTPLIPLDDNEVTEQQRMCSAHSHIKTTCSEPVLRVKQTSKVSFREFLPHT